MIKKLALTLSFVTLMLPWPSYGQTDSTAEPQLFMPGIVSLPDRYEFGSIFNADGSEFYFAIQHDGWTEIHMIHQIRGGWSAPIKIIGSSSFSANDPFLSNDGQRLYFITPRNGQYDIGYIERGDDGQWSEAKFPSGPINSTANEYYISFTQAGDMVFASDRNAKAGDDFDLYIARRTPGGYAPAEAFPSSINSLGYEADAFIAPDESYVIFSSNREGGLGRGDLYISFAQTDGGWSQAVSMGDIINSEGHELCPFVSHDGKYLYYTSKRDIYRIDASIIDNLRPADP